MGRVKRTPHSGDTEGIIMYKHTNLLIYIYRDAPECGGDSAFAASGIILHLN